jgi:mRNA interferase MazF
MKKGEIWETDLPYSDGKEQSGRRPSAIISEIEANMAIIVPFTSNVQALRFQNSVEVEPSIENGLDSLSIALCFQVRAVDKKRLLKRIGELESRKVKEIDASLKRMLGL